MPAPQSPFCVLLPMLNLHFDRSNMRLRLLSAAFMGPLVLAAVFLGTVFFGALVAAAMTIGLYEWLRLIDRDLHKRTIAVACAMLLAALAVGFLFTPGLGALAAVAFTLALYVVARADSAQAAWIAVGIPYMAGAGLAFFSLRGAPGGLGMTLYLLAVVWSTDIGAFLVGRAVGGAKMAPVISPNKTWSGLAGGIAFAIIFGYLAAAVLGAHLPWVALLLAVPLAVVAQLGDLFESYFKRRANVKESGDLIPGHGGVLDRVDGLVFAAMALALFQSAFGRQTGWW